MIILDIPIFKSLGRDVNFYFSIALHSLFLLTILVLCRIPSPFRQLVFGINSLSIHVSYNAETSHLTAPRVVAPSSRDGRYYFFGLSRVSPAGVRKHMALSLVKLSIFKFKNILLCKLSSSFWKIKDKKVPNLL